MVINTRELNKMYIHHLQKYHTTEESQQSNSPCILFQHYRNKLQSNVNIEAEILEYYKSDGVNSKNKENLNSNNIGDLKLSEKEKDDVRLKIINSNYHLNAQFFVEILEASIELSSKLNVIRYKTGTYHLEIIEDLIYCGFNLKGFDLDLLDCFKGVSVDENNSITQPQGPQISKTVAVGIGNENENEKVVDMPNMVKTKMVNQEKGVYNATQSIDIFSSNNNNNNTITTTNNNNNNNNDNNSNIIPIEMIVYPYGFKERSRGLDLTINSMVIHFSDILIKNAKYDNKIINFDWKCHIQNSRKEMNGTKDAINGWITTWGDTVSEKELVIKSQKPWYHIMRISKMFGKFVDHPKKFRLQDLENVIDPMLLKATQNYYPRWLTVENFSDTNEFETRGKTFCKWFIGFFVRLMSQTALKQMDYRMKGLDIIKFHDKWVPIVNDDVNNAQTYFKQEIAQRFDENDEISMKRKNAFLQELKKYGYSCSCFS